ncbi:MAG: leucine--tRNA ligase [Anaerolinea sp.]|nr:leucine--tRNA ligase [Anaerolinea sp.]
MNTTHYPFQAIEQKWRASWEQLNLYQADDNADKPRYYVLDFFPYPSGAGLSVGHCRNYVPTCVDARFHRMRGYNVLHPMGWDAFGLPAENYAIAHHIHPRDSTKLFTDTYRRQMKLVECSYDWSREINSTDPDYYRWTQWFFLLLHRRGLAYQSLGEQWWCDHCQTILANEQVEAGCCWRCHNPVTKKALRQWYFRITAYAERLLADLEQIDWPDSIKTMQRNWIGRSTGAEITFTVTPGVAPGVETDASQAIPVFTTRPDTLYGVTFLALAPEHPLLAQVTTPTQADAVAAYTAQARRMTEIDRLSTEREKTGVFTGTTAVHPLTGATVPVWVADYVLPGYGTGAVMGVPGHDARDHAFARAYGLPIREVISPDGREHGTEGCFTEYGVLLHSGRYSGMNSAEAMAQITADLQAAGLGRAQVTYKMRDWLISRQRYWGAPIPIIHCPACGAVPVPEDDLPVRLPYTDDFAPAGDGRSPLARLAEWVNTTCPACGRPAQRETDTLDGFACSSWYFLRFASPHYQDGPVDPQALRRWLPVDVYVGGAEHAVMHLLYARFWTKVMYDAGIVPFAEPFPHLKNQGVLHAADGQRMSKSRGNVVTPDEVIAAYGTDALRAYILFLGPFDGDVLWDERGIMGVRRFLDKFWRLCGEFDAKMQRDKGAQEDKLFAQRLQQAIQRMMANMEQFRFNTAVATLMAYLNELLEWQSMPVAPAQWRAAVECFTLLLAPICPFIAEEAWQETLGHTESVHRQAWPTYDAALAAAAVVTVVVQVNGKVRDRLTLPSDVPEETLRETAVATPGAQRFIAGRAIRQVIVVPNRLVNIVAP